MTSWLRGALRRNVDEIAADPVLRAYGVALALVHVLTFVFWRSDLPLAQVLPVGATPICWPFFEDCHRFRVLGVGGVDAILWGYLVLAVAGALLFARRSSAGAAYACLAVLEVVKVLIVVQDYRLRMNQHYMASLATLVFLGFPAKARLLQYLIVLLYVWAGILKLNRDWLSGAVLDPRQVPWLPDALAPAAWAYVVVLETVVVFGLWSRRPWAFWGALGQLAVFHAASYPIVGFYYPSLMAALLTIFALVRLAGGEGDRPGPARLLAGREPRSAYGLLAGFCLLQLVPHAFPGDPAITGEGRLFALHMFDARVVCEAHVTVHDGRGGRRRVRITPLVPARVRCDPIVYLSVARALCRQGAEHGRWTDLDLSLRSRRATDIELRPVVQVNGFCGRDLTYDVWRPNAWILR